MNINMEYINTSEPVMQEYLLTVLCNMSILLRDEVGKVPYYLVPSITEGLTVSTLGELTRVEVEAPSLPREDLFGAVRFHPVLTKGAFSIFKQIEKQDSSIIYRPVLVSSENPRNLILDHEIGDRNYEYLVYVYIELYNLFKALVEYKDGDPFGLTLSDIDTFLGNTKFIYSKLGSLDNSEEVYGTLRMLKHVQRAILYVKTGIPLILR